MSALGFEPVRMRRRRLALQCIWVNIYTRQHLPEMKSKTISNDQELIKSDPTSCPQNQKQFTKGTRGKPNEQLFSFWTEENHTPMNNTRSCDVTRKPRQG